MSTFWAEEALRSPIVHRDKVIKKRAGKNLSTEVSQLVHCCAETTEYKGIHFQTRIVNNVALPVGSLYMHNAFWRALRNNPTLKLLSRADPFQIAPPSFLENIYRYHDSSAIANMLDQVFDLFNHYKPEGDISKPVVPLTEDLVATDTLHWYDWSEDNRTHQHLKALLEAKEITFTTHGGWSYRDPDLPNKLRIINPRLAEMLQDPRKPSRPGQTEAEALMDWLPEDGPVTKLLLTKFQEEGKLTDKQCAEFQEYKAEQKKRSQIEQPNEKPVMKSPSIEDLVQTIFGLDKSSSSSSSEGESDESPDKSPSQNVSSAVASLKRIPSRKKIVRTGLTQLLEQPTVDRFKQRQPSTVLSQEGLIERILEADSKRPIQQQLRQHTSKSGWKSVLLGGTNKSVIELQGMFNESSA